MNRPRNQQLPASKRTASLKAKTRKPVRPLLAITMGDPAGIGPEIIVKALNNPRVWRVCRPIVIGSLPVIGKASRSLRSPVRAVSIENPEEFVRKTSPSAGLIPIMDPFDDPLGRFHQGQAGAVAGEASIQCVKTAVQLAQNERVAGIVTAPINKKSIHLAGYSYPGHTELLGTLTRSKEVGMMILGGPLRILFVTTHLALKAVPAEITRARVGRAIRLADKGLRECFHIARPRIAVAGLNPHAGEDGLFGTEEGRAIAPAVKHARASGIQCTGPYPADTLFGKAVRGEFDGVVAMYHDQGLVALKTVAFGHCINLTIGLPILRTSVDHGTAYDIVGKGKADPSSLIEAILLAARLASSKV